MAIAAEREPIPSFQTGYPILESKLRPVVPRPGTVARPRLVHRLVDPKGPQVISVIAPPGYGKTTLLAHWTAAVKVPVAWLTLDDHDNDVRLMCSSIATAFDRIRPLDPGVASGLSGAAGRILSTAVPRLLSDLARWPHPAILVLDDAHRLSDRASLDALTAIIEHLPPSFRVAIAGRVDPGLPLARLRVQAALLEISESDLALDPDEVRAVAAMVGCHLSEEEARSLADRTEGWPTAVYLASLAAARDPAEAPSAPIAVGRAHLAAYLRSEVEALLDDDDICFLTRTAILDHVTIGLAEAVSGLPDAGPRLRRLADRNLLVQELPTSPPSYRYHNLLREFLESELERREPGATAELHRQAMAWHQRHGDVTLAVDHAFACGDVATAARVAAGAFLRLFYQGHLTTMERWLARFSLAEVEAYPPLAVDLAWLRLMSGQPDEADRLADIADRSSFSGPSPDGISTFESERALLRAVMARRGPRQMRDDAQLALALEPPNSPRRALSLLMLAAAQRMLGEDAAAEATLAESASGTDRVAIPLPMTFAMQAVMSIRRGRWDVAAGEIAEARERIARAGYEGLVQALLLHAVEARVAIHAGDLDAGRRALVRAQLVRPLANHAAPWISVEALLELARAYLAISDPAGAQLVTREAEAIVRKRPMLGTLTTELVELHRRVGSAASTLAGSSTLTAAELRVLPLLPTYLSFQDIADRLSVSRNTVKTHAMSIYGKLWASSRGEAVERAVELGLLEPYPGLAPFRAVGGDGEGD